MEAKEVRIRYPGPIHAHVLALASTYALRNDIYITLLRRPRRLSYSGRNEILLEQELRDHRGFKAHVRVFEDVKLEPSYVRIELPSKGIFEHGLLSYAREIRRSGDKLLRAKFSEGFLKIYDEGQIDEYIQLLKSINKDSRIEDLKRVESQFGRITSLSERRRRKLKTYGTIDYVIEVDHEFLDYPVYLVAVMKGNGGSYETALTQIYADALYRKLQSKYGKVFVLGITLYASSSKYAILVATYYSKMWGVYKGRLDNILAHYGALTLLGNPQNRREFFEKNIKHIVSYALKFEIIKALEKKSDVHSGEDRRTGVPYYSYASYIAS